MQIARESHDKLIQVGSGVLLAIFALALVWTAEHYDAPYLLFPAGWLTASAWRATRARDVDD